jgi:hypothetical protein
MNTDEKFILPKVKTPAKRCVLQARRNDDYQLKKSVFIRVHPWLN